MAGNSIGKIFSLTTFGESHGPAIGGVIDGCPAGVRIDVETIQSQLNRRKPGQSAITTQRKESDTVEILSGIFEGITTGAPIGFLIRNKDAKSSDYTHLKETFRPSHADYTFDKKYGTRDYRGGGRSSARETACRVVAGAIANTILKQLGVNIVAYVDQIGGVKCSKDYSELDLSKVDTNDVRCPDALTAESMLNEIQRAQKAGDSLGGVIKCVATGVPAGWGEPVFDKIHADLGKAMLSINAVKGFEIGSGFAGSEMHGSEHNDTFINEGGKIATDTNNAGGVLGGITNGSDIYFRTAFKPTATIMQDQQSVDKKGNAVTVKGKGRHDPCVLPRAVPIVEAMTAIILADHYFRNLSAKI